MDGLQDSEPTDLWYSGEGPGGIVDGLQDSEPTGLWYRGEGPGGIVDGQQVFGIEGRVPVA